MGREATGTLTRLWLFVAAAVVPVLGAGCLGSGGSSTAAELRRRLEAVAEPADFAFRFRAGGTRVNDCFLPNREFAGRVDADRELLAVSPAPGETPVVISTAETTFLHGSLFAGGTTGGEWLRLTQRGEAVAETLNRLLGPDLAAYAAPGALPPSGRTTAVALLGVATKVSPLGSSVIQGEPAQGFRLTADVADAPRETAEPAARRGGPRQVAEFEIWLSPSDQVVRIEVRPTPAGEEDGGEPPPGWLTDYDPSPQDIDVDPPADAISIDPKALAGMAPRRLASCELPV